MKDPKDITINGKQLSDILETHKLWLMDKGGERADLRYADLSYADLSCADLSCADLSCADLRSADLSSANLRYANLSYANLSYANLRYADLSYADLSYANLSCADLSYADLSYANLSYANLRYADLRYANLRYADLRYANLSYANLRYAKNAEWADAITKIIPDGNIVGWKKCNEGIVKLLIPAKAKRSNATGRKCRAEFAKDVAHFTFDGKRTKKIFTSLHNSDFVYEVGKMIKPEAWDENRWEECSSGIHFYITRYEAEKHS
jgi:uncharacterized protein DUF5758/pentapeptide repeat protein